MSDELPPLPDTRDPWELLGVARGADEREIKRAYARLIKVYRPDRAPEAFDRIHGAFEHVRACAASVPGEPVAEPEPAAAGPPPAAPDAAAEAAPDDGQPDPRRAAALFERYQALIADGRLDEVEAALRDVHDEAIRDPEVTIAALRAIAALGWRRASAEPLFDELGEIGARHGLDGLCELVAHDLDVAAGWRVARPELPAALTAYIVDAALHSSARFVELREELGRMLKHEPLALLGPIDRLVAAHPELGGLLVGHLGRFTPVVPERLGELPLVEFHALGIAIVSAARDAQRAGWAYPLAVLAGFGLLGGGFAPLAPAPLIAVLAYRLATTRWYYRRRVRAVVADVLARAGVPSGLVAEWLDLNGRLARAIATFSPAIRGDEGLALFGAVATLVRAHERHDAEHDDSAEPDDDDDADDDADGDADGESE